MPALFFPVVALAVLAVVFRWATHTFPPLGRHPWRVAAVLVALFVATLVTRQAEMRWHVGGWLGLVLVSAVSTLILAGAPIALLHVVGALVSRGRKTSAAASAPLPLPESASASEVSRRQLVEGAGGLALLAGAGTMIGWGIVRGRHAFELCEIPVRIPGLPRALERLRDRAGERPAHGAPGRRAHARRGPVARPPGPAGPPRGHGGHRRPRGRVRPARGPQARRPRPARRGLRLPRQP